MSASRSILFIGDSVTDCGRRDDPDGLGDGYVRLIAHNPALTGMRVTNRGISGNRVVDLEGRWQHDVLDAAPDVLTILIGINDTWRRYDSANPTSARDFEAGYRRLLDSAATDGRTLVLMEPFVLPVTEQQRAWHPEDLDEKIAVVHGLARDFDAILVPLDAALTTLADELTPEALADDGVHPTPLGHDAIAALWLQYAGAAL